MKKFLILLIVVAAGYAAVKLSIKSPDQSIPLATDTTMMADTQPDGTVPDGAASDTKGTAVPANGVLVEFTGYGPGGKIENGSVKAKESSLMRADGIFSGSVSFDMTSITSAPVKDKLIEHLKGSDFFNVAVYPTATFAVTSATATEVKGNLTMKGITKAIALPLSYDTASTTYMSTVRVNMEDFGIKQTFTDKEFLLKISVK